MAEEVDVRDRYRIVGACIVWRRIHRIPKYLILKRRVDIRIYPGLWTVPSGGMELADYVTLPQTNGGWENPLQRAVRREVREEAGIEVGELTFLNDFAFIRPDGVPVFGVRFAAPYVSGEVKLDPDEMTEYAWIAEYEMAEYALLGNIAAEIRALDERLFSGEL